MTALIWEYQFCCDEHRSKHMPEQKETELLLIPEDRRDPRALVIEFDTADIAEQHRPRLGLFFLLHGWKLVERGQGA